MKRNIITLLILLLPVLCFAGWHLDTNSVIATTLSCSGCVDHTMVLLSDDYPYTGAIKLLGGQKLTPPIDGTVVNSGEIRRQIYAHSFPYTKFTTNNTISDAVIVTLPANTEVFRVIAKVTTPFNCGVVCDTSQLTMKCGKTFGGAEYLKSFDVHTAAAVFGDADSEVGTSLNAANGPDIPSWSTTTSLDCRLVSGAGAIGTGSASNLDAGEFTVYVDYQVIP